MRRLILAGVMTLTAFSAYAQTTCSAGPYLTKSQMETAFNGKYVYGGTSPNNYDELHTFQNANSGSLQDYKQGTGNAKDPTTTTPGGYATFALQTNGGSPDTIQYTYAAGFQTPQLSVISNGGTSYTFCNGSAAYTTATAAATPGFGPAP